ncbi:hypothetical protein IW261DRAFT_1349287 [Armillaria novae-zelandiae]|uniref:Uncharacterized protein n=1 Tax=Armillaria novae-zelandiae TaxID=153914 RepID=A0AA39N882_9AGAR|nr:hypothetical protein IW261DRAFT_1349287 [Armillaria novae-zelandiae]
MHYCVRRGTTMSHFFSSDIGILAGNGTSPSIWNFFGSDFRPHPHPDDVYFGDRPILNVEHADDGALWSMSAHGIQSHCNEYGMWASSKGLLINFGKTKALFFGTHPRVLPTIMLQGRTLEWTDDAKYLGILFRTMAVDIFKEHSLEVAKKALRICNVTLAMGRFLGDIHPRAGLAIYSARADSLLTYGSQVVVITADRTLRQLERVQITFFRRLLHVHRRSMIAALHSETGFTPVRYQRMILVMRYLQCLLSERTTTTRLAPLGVDACQDLWSAGKKCWLTDIAHALRSLYHPINVCLDDLCDPRHVVTLVSEVDALWKTEVVDEITGSPMTSLLAAPLWECNGAPAAFCSYLNVRIPAHRIALTRALTASHQLAIEHGKWHGIDKEWRLCRMCSNDVEDVPHVLFLCPFPPADSIRGPFLSSVWGCYPSWKVTVRSPTHLLLLLAGTDDLVDTTAHFVHELFTLWESVPLLLNHQSTAEAVREYS